MSIERTYYCDAPECERHATTATSRLPVSFLRLVWDEHVLHFCSWDCVLWFGAALPPTEVIEA